MKHLGFAPCLADPDLWMRADVRPCDGFEYYAYVLLYVDDVLVVHHDAEDVLLCLDKYFKMKPGSIGDPDVYLGATIKQMRLANGVMAWASSPSKYVQASVDTVTKYLTNLGDERWSMPKKASTGNGARNGYHPDTQPRAGVVVCLTHWNAPMDGRDRMSRHHHGSIKNGLPNGIATGGPPRRAPTHVRFSTNLPQFTDGVRSVVPHNRHGRFQT